MAAGQRPYAGGITARYRGAYLQWIRGFPGFHSGAHSRELPESDFNRFLIHPTGDGGVTPTRIGFNQFSPKRVRRQHEDDQQDD